MMLDDLKAVELRSENLGLGILAGRGGHIEWLRDEIFHRDWLAEFGRQSVASRATIFSEGSRAGFDECFPSITSCADPNPGREGLHIADHGDFWSSAWTIRSRSETSLVLDTSDIEHPLYMRKSVALETGTARASIEYHLENRGKEPYRYIYSAHPLFSWPADARIFMPVGVTMSVAFGGEVFPTNFEGRWPTFIHHGNELDIGKLAFAGAVVNYKVFVASSGTCALRIAGYERDLVIETDPTKLPWFGVCVNRYAWPNSSEQERWIAIEPTTSPCDSLIDAIEGGTNLCLLPGETSNWKISLSLVTSAEGLRVP